MRITQEASIRKGKAVQEKKGLLRECQQIALMWRKPNRVDRLEESGWEKKLPSSYEANLLRSLQAT